MTDKVKKPAATNVLNWICSEKWAITEEWLKTIVQIATRENFESKYEALLARGGQPLRNTRNVSIRGNTAIVPLLGPIFPRANLFTEISGATSIEQLGHDLMTAVESPEIENIILSIDSPGGQTTGIGEFAELVFGARDKKNIIAFVEGGANSAAYWIASQASQIILAPGAMVGSIGTMVTFLDDSKRMAENGLKEIEIVSNLSPNKNRDPSTKAGRQDVLEVLDELTRVFASAVGKGRGVSMDTVFEKFGQGKVFVGQQAIDLGMADSTGTLESVIAEITSTNNQSTGGQLMSLDVSKMTAEELKANNAALYNQIKEEGITEGKKTGEAEGYVKGVTAEGKRIQEVEAFDSPENKEIIAKHKFDSTKSATEIAGLVLLSQKVKTEKKAEAIVKDGEDLGDTASNIDGGTAESEVEAQNEAAISNMTAGANGSRQRYQEPAHNSGQESRTLK